MLDKKFFFLRWRYFLCFYIFFLFFRFCCFNFMNEEISVCCWFGTTTFCHSGWFCWTVGIVLVFEEEEQYHAFIWPISSQCYISIHCENNRKQQKTIRFSDFSCKFEKRWLNVSCKSTRISKLQQIMSLCLYFISSLFYCGNFQHFHPAILYCDFSFINQN